MTPVDCAKQKVSAVIDTINFVRELDFPYDPPREAVDFIRNIFSEHLQHLDGISVGTAARTMCRQVSEDIDNFLLAVGFMVRACDNRGALELQRPLMRLAHRAIGPHIKLVISSDWRFSPFTLLYPGEFGDRFVLVGLPISEAGNPLIAPLAGHELGHNIWRRLPALNVYINDQVKSKVNATIKFDLWEEFSKAFSLKDKEDIDQEDLFGAISPWQLAKTRAFSHCEEMFCDFVALSIFGEGYLHAFQYLISPGGGFRNPVYPSMRNRIAALIVACKGIGLATPTGFNDEFDESDVSSDYRQQLLLQVSDDVSRSLVDELAEVAKTWCERQGVINHNPSDVDRIVKLFNRVIPATAAESLANIINAAWHVSLNLANPWKDDYPITKEPGRRASLTRELALKSFEVFEIERTQEDN